MRRNFYKLATLARHPDASEAFKHIAEFYVIRHAKLALTHVWCSSAYSAPINLARSRSSFPRPYIWRLTA